MAPKAANVAAVAKIAALKPAKPAKGPESNRTSKAPVKAKSDQKDSSRKEASGSPKDSSMKKKEDKSPETKKKVVKEEKSPESKPKGGATPRKNSPVLSAASTVVRPSEGKPSDGGTPPKLAMPKPSEGGGTPPKLAMPKLSVGPSDSDKPPIPPPPPAVEVIEKEEVEDIEEAEVAAVEEPAADGGEETDPVQAVFDNMDHNHDGTLSMAEVFKGLEELGVEEAPQEESTIFGAFDEDGSGSIDAKEFTDMYNIYNLQWREGASEEPVADEAPPASVAAAPDNDVALSGDEGGGGEVGGDVGGDEGGDRGGDEGGDEGGDGDGDGGGDRGGDGVDDGGGDGGDDGGEAAAAAVYAEPDGTGETAALGSSGEAADFQAAAAAADFQAAAAAAAAATAAATAFVSTWIDPILSLKPGRPLGPMSPGFDEPGPATRASTLEALEAAQEAIEEAAADAGEQAAEDEKYADKTEQAWKDCEGELLEPFLEWVDDLGGPPIRLLDARFLIGLANAGGVLARRQDLPDGAFFDLPRLKRESWGYGGASLRVLIIFLPWLQRDHPDPKGAQLRRIAALLESFVADDGGSYAVFLSYCSVPQIGLNGDARSEEDAQLCTMALPGLAELYSHGSTFLIELTSLPDDYPDAYDWADDANPITCSFHDRGWNFAESMATKLSKNSAMVLDCSKFTPPQAPDGESEPPEPPFLEDVVTECRGTRRPPLTVDDFRALLETKAFERCAHTSACNPCTTPLPLIHSPPTASRVPALNNGWLPLASVTQAQ